jgi:group I intron endonuclease
MKVDYSKGKIYKITNDYNDDIYVGSSCDTLVKRFSTHKLALNNEVKKNRPLYKLMNEIGFDRFRIQLIIDYPCEDKYQLRQKEGKYIRDLGTLNKVIAGRTDREYHEEYYKQNKDKIKEQKERKKPELNQYDKDYYQQNKEKINLRKSTKISCNCGCIVRKDSWINHKKTQKHIDLMDKQNQEQKKSNIACPKCDNCNVELIQEYKVVIVVDVKIGEDVKKLVDIIT